MDDPAAQLRNTKALIIHDRCVMGIETRGSLGHLTDRKIPEL